VQPNGRTVRRDQGGDTVAAGQAQAMLIATALHDARRIGRPVPADVGGLAADSLGARQVGELVFPIAAAHVAASVLVPDSAIRAAQHVLWDRLRVLAEPGGATALAALLSGAFAAPAGARVGVLVCGANADPATLSPEVT